MQPFCGPFQFLIAQLQKTNANQLWDMIRQTLDRKQLPVRAERGLLTRCQELPVEAVPFQLLD